jgi:hypothetical protein
MARATVSLGQRGTVAGESQHRRRRHRHTQKNPQHLYLLRTYLSFRDCIQALTPSHTEQRGWITGKMNFSVRFDFRLAVSSSLQLITFPKVIEQETPRFFPEITAAR